LENARTFDNTPICWNNSQGTKVNEIVTGILAQRQCPKLRQCQLDFGAIQHAKVAKCNTIILCQKKINSLHLQPVPLNFFTAVINLVL
jgi:hypothetical protein